MRKLVVAVLACLVMPGYGEASSVRRALGSTEAAVAWSPSVRASSGVELSAPALGVASSGAALAAFSESASYSAATRSLEIAAAPAGQPFSTGTTFSDSASSPALAVAADGRAVLTYARELSPSKREAMITRGNVNGTFKTPVSLRQADPPRAVALAPDGTAVLVTEGYRRKHFYVDVRLVGPDGRLGTPHRLGDAGLSAAGALAVGPDGTVALTYTASRRFTTRVRVATRSPGGPLRISTVMRGRYGDPQVAVGPRGRLAVVATSIKAIGEGNIYGGVVIAERSATHEHFHTPVRLPVTPRRKPYAFGPTIAFDYDGHPTVAWIQDADPSDTEGEAEDARGVSYSWDRGRKSRLDTRTREVTLAATPAGVLALTDTGPWQAFLITPSSTRRVRAPQGRSDYATSSLTDRNLQASPARTVFAFTGIAPEHIELSTTTTVEP